MDLRCSHCDKYYILLMCLALAILTHAYVPGLECAPLTVQDLGSTTEFSRDGLIARSIIFDAAIVRIPIRILNYKILCEATGILRNTASSVSVLVEFQCEGLGASRSCDRRTRITRQFQFGCSRSRNVFDFESSDPVNISPIATFDTELDTSCLSASTEAQ